MEKNSLDTIYPYLKLKALTLTTFLLLAINAFSQPYQDLSRDEKVELSIKLVKETPFIFEGEIIDFKAFEGENGRIFTSVHVHTHHSYKGRVVVDEEVEIIMRGGYLNGRVQGNTHSIGLEDFLGKKSKYIFLCRRNESLPVPEQGIKEQYYQFQIEELSVVIRDMNRIYGTNAWAGLYWLTFKDRTEMDNFLGGIDDLDIPPPKKRD